jgi:hypothetical protein
VNHYIVAEELWNRILHTLWDCQEVNLCVRIREESRPYKNQREFDESIGRGYRCIHCEVRNGVQFCHYHDVPIQNQREKVLDELKGDLKTRFVSSSNQWSKGRNSGLIECCNIIDEYIKAGEP